MVVFFSNECEAKIVPVEKSVFTQKMSVMPPYLRKKVQKIFVTSLGDTRP